MTTSTTTAGTTMRAIIQENYGEAENVLRLGQVGRPAIGDREVLLRVYAAGVDRGVWHLVAGLPHAVRLAGYGIRAPKTPVPGREVAGRVEAVGAEVTTLAVGDEVFGIAEGSFAEYARARAGKLAPKSSNLTLCPGRGRIRPDRPAGGPRPRTRAGRPAGPGHRRLLCSENQADLLALTELIESGQVTPAIDETYPLSETITAIRHMRDDHARGNVIIQFQTQKPSLRHREKQNSSAPSATRPTWLIRGARLREGTRPSARTDQPEGQWHLPRGTRPAPSSWSRPCMTCAGPAAVCTRHDVHR